MKKVLITANKLLNQKGSDYKIQAIFLNQFLLK